MISPEVSTIQSIPEYESRRSAGAGLSPQASVRPVAAVPGASPLPTMIIFDADSRGGFALAEAMRRGTIAVNTVVLSNRVPLAVLERHGAEIAAVRLGDSGDGLVFAVDLSRSQPWVQVLFWTDGPASESEVSAAQNLGITRILERAQLAQWLEQATVPLARYARAKRELAQAEASLPALPPPRSTLTALPLPQAERKFRETYLRRVLSESPSQREAAVKAGIPYTTLSSMIKKLGL